MNIENENKPVAAIQRVYTAQVRDIISDADMEPFRPDDHEARDTIEIYIVPEPPSQSRFLVTLGLAAAGRIGLADGRMAAGEWY